MNPPVVVGIDLSLTGTGIATDAGTKLLRSTGHKDDTLTQRAARLTTMVTGIIAEVDELWVDLIAVEAPSLGQGRQSGTHDRSGLWWLVVHALLTDGYPVIEVPPASVKKYVTGRGNAPKNVIAGHLVQRFGILIEDDNEADAFALRAIGLDLLGHPLAKLPAANRSVLEKLPRPDLRGAA